MKVFANAAMMVGAVALMGWLMVAQQDYQQGWSTNLTAQTSPANETHLANSMDRALLALN